VHRLLDYSRLFDQSQAEMLSALEAQLEQKLRQLDHHPQSPLLLLAERDEIAFLAGFLASQLRGVPLVLGNPQWRRREWQQVQGLLTCNLVWGQVRLNMSSNAQTSNTQTHPPAGTILIPTGGTSGRIRFAVHTWEGLTASALGFRDHIQGQQINCYCTLPLFHVSGLMQVVRSLVTRGQLVFGSYKALQAGVLPAFEPEQFWISLVPTQLQRLLQNPRLIPWLQRFEGILLGGGPAWPGLLEMGRSQGLPLALTYGMTETASQVATLQPREFLAGNNSSGRVLPHGEIIITDASGCPVKPGETGKLTILAKSLMRGYYGEFEWDKPSLGELVTDDYGYFDEAGYLHILGRGSQMIISGGEKVFPSEVEAVLRESPGIEDVCVFGMADEDWGEVVVALYVPAGSESSEEIIMEGRSRLAQQLASYKHPKCWLATERIPRNSRGKLEQIQVQRLVSALRASKESAKDGDDE